MKALLFLLLCALLVCGCSLFSSALTTKTADGDTVLTPAGENLKSAIVTTGQAVTGPMGVPPVLWEWAAVAILSVLGVKGSVVAVKKIRASPKGKVLE